jgi:hypothetical protein
VACRMPMALLQHVMPCQALQRSLLASRGSTASTAAAPTAHRS